MTGADLRSRRRALGMTQGALASALGVTDRTVRLWEAGHHAIPAWVPLALATVERAAPTG